MTIAKDIIQSRMPDFQYYLHLGESLDDIDEYGFTPLIECAIGGHLEIAEALLTRGVQIDKPDVTGRTALHWAVDNQDLELTRLLLTHKANPNAYTRAGMSVLVYPSLRGQDELKHLLYQHGAQLPFCLDFINTKLLGHRFELQGDTDIVDPNNEFIELDFEGFILEFSVAILNDSLRRFTSSYSTRHLRGHFPYLHTIMDALAQASELLSMQHHPELWLPDRQKVKQMLKNPLLILPAASRGHAIGFVKFHHWWVKIDRGENAAIEGSVNIYKMANPEAVTVDFIEQFLLKKQPRRYFHQLINKTLGLTPFAKLPISPQTSGNCSWANIQAVIAAGYAVQFLEEHGTLDANLAMGIFEQWEHWDQDRALDECIQRFYIADNLRKASICSTLAAVLVQACDYKNPLDLKRSEKILSILTLPDYYYILDSYIQEFCVKRLTRRGDNLLKLLEDYGFDPIK